VLYNLFTTFSMLNVFSKICYRFYAPNKMLIDLFIFVIPMIVGVIFSCDIYFLIFEKQLRIITVSKLYK